MKRTQLGFLLAGLVLIGAGCGSNSSPVANQKTPEERVQDIKNQIETDPVLKAREDAALKMRIAIKQGQILKVGDVQDRVTYAQGSVRLVKVGTKISLALSDDFSVTTQDPITVKLSRYSNPRNSAEVEARGSLGLGTLTYNSGGQLIDLPAGTDVSVFRSVVFYSPTAKVIYALATFQT
ncbi:MAG TPA: hypothetical protein VFQ60_02530 [Patescibacteria group bacterium]|nr:hypothetical protein [Patescibacteria group bacterium]